MENFEIVKKEVGEESVLISFNSFFRVFVMSLSIHFYFLINHAKNPTQILPDLTSPMPVILA